MDENLGPSMAEHEDYKPDVLTKRLLNHENYKFFLKAQAMLELQKQQ
jgi:hypothetical protein